MATVNSHSAKSVSVEAVKKPKKYGEVKTFSADELPRLEPNLKKTETVYSISEGENLSNYENVVKTITFKSDAKENMLVIFMNKCKKCNLLLDSINSNLNVKNPENKCVCLIAAGGPTGGAEGSNLIAGGDEENIVRKALFLEYYNLKYLIHYIDGINFNDYIIRGCNCIYYVDEEESIIINKYLDKMENVCKFPLIRYKKMLNIIIAANRKATSALNLSLNLSLKAEVESTTTEGSTNSGSASSMSAEKSSTVAVPIVYGGSDNKDDQSIEDLNESFKDKTKRKNYIKYSTLEERRDARLKQTTERLNKRELCAVCNCDVRLGGLSKHLLTNKHKGNLAKPTSSSFPVEVKLEDSNLKLD